MHKLAFCVTAISVIVIGSSAMAQGKAPEASSPAAEKTQIEANTAASEGDWRKAGELSGQAYHESPSLVNEFNLAAFYAHNGQYALAVPLYADVAANGQFTKGLAVYDYRHNPRPAREGFNYTDESNRRLAELTGATPPLASNR